MGAISEAKGTYFYLFIFIFLVVLPFPFFFLLSFTGFVFSIHFVLFLLVSNLYINSLLLIIFEILPSHLIQQKVKDF